MLHTILFTVSSIIAYMSGSLSTFTFWCKNCSEYFDKKEHPKLAVPSGLYLHWPFQKAEYLTNPSSGAPPGYYILAEISFNQAKWISFFLWIPFVIITMVRGSGFFVSKLYDFAYPEKPTPLPLPPAPDSYLEAANKEVETLIS